MKLVYATINLYSKCWFYWPEYFWCFPVWKASTTNSLHIAAFFYPEVLFIWNPASGITSQKKTVRYPAAWLWRIIALRKSSAQFLLSSFFGRNLIEELPPWSATPWRDLAFEIDVYICRFNSVLPLHYVGWINLKTLLSHRLARKWL